jgi:hypothetical protein
MLEIPQDAFDSLPVQLGWHVHKRTNLIYNKCQIKMSERQMLYPVETEKDLQQDTHQK